MLGVHRSLRLSHSGLAPAAPTQLRSRAAGPRCGSGGAGVGRDREQQASIVGQATIGHQPANPAGTLSPPWGPHHLP